jgi:ABC-2 type transport system permease protein
MKALNTFLFEGKHFIRNPFKVVALLLFVIAGIYGLHNGASLYNTHKTQIETLDEKAAKERQDILNYYEEGKVGPEGRPWVNYTEPFWAVYSSYIYKFKEPSAAMVYSLGQAEQYGFYKRVTFQSTPYDSDLAEEIANPERLQTGTLDFSFVLLFLMPLVLLILIYNLKSYENEQGFLPLILVQSASKNIWLLSRVGFYLVITFVTIIALLVYGALLTDVFATANQAFGEMLLLSFLYLIFWGILYLLILRKGKSILANTLQMVGVFLLFTFLIPAGVHQWISIEKPANLMTDFIDATRDEVYALYDQPDSIKEAKLFALFPQVQNTEVAKDSIRKQAAMLDSFSALSGQLVKESMTPIQMESEEKNRMIQSTYWFNPVVYFQNRFNKNAKTHYEDYQQYREEIQASIDRQLQVMIPDTYNAVKVDKNKFLDYINQFNNDQ